MIEWFYFVGNDMAEQTIKTMEIPLDHRDKQAPMITSTMKQYLMGEFEWTEDAPYYDENGELHEHTATHTVPWDLCKRIYKQMATMANGSPEMELEREKIGAGLYYLQDSRSYVGNDVLWWAKDGKGYTTDLRKAHVYTKDEAVRQHNCRETDIPWPKDYIDAKTRPAVDMQYIDRDVALSWTGIKLRKPERSKRQPYKCFHCGKFMREEQQYGPCPHCGGDNRP